MTMSTNIKKTTKLVVISAGSCNVCTCDDAVLFSVGKYDEEYNNGSSGEEEWYICVEMGMAPILLHGKDAPNMSFPSRDGAVDAGLRFLEEFIEKIIHIQTS